MLTAKAACDYTKRPEGHGRVIRVDIRVRQKALRRGKGFCTFGPAGSTGWPSTSDRQALAAPPRLLVLGDERDGAGSGECAQQAAAHVGECELPGTKR
jgi:hypothetical protein